jgi:hypothetical protein
MVLVQAIVLEVVKSSVVSCVKVIHSDREHGLSLIVRLIRCVEGNLLPLMDVKADRTDSNVGVKE